jgi:hypothetical protein
MQKYIFFSNIGTTLAKVILDRVNGQHLISRLVAKSDKAASVVKFYPAGKFLKATATGATSQKVITVGSIVAQGYTVRVGDYVIVATPTGVFMDIVASVDSGAGTITMTANLAYAVAVGSRASVVNQDNIGSITNGAAAQSLECPFAGNVDMPCAITLDGTAACNINGLAELI